MISIAVQAGGNSTRMGQEKALVLLQGKPLVGHVLDRLTGIGEDVFITSNNPEMLDLPRVRVVPDVFPGAGALNGLRTALEAARGDPVVVAACDMPFVSRELFRYMLKRSRDYDLVVPCPGGFYEPMHAVYSKSALPAVHQALERGQKRMISIFAGLRVLLVDDAALHVLDPHGMAFFNVNTPEDLETAEQNLIKCKADI